ncbi:iron-containing redox enzyme family protein [Burkholderia metallica]|uniref:iron-containing redox enzyme family protein n=1 Tax=Burkholderia metallica TaxID=488729 RepID=UPI001CF41278|nr:iron-containing redox enzyme family protein [Burkholderia metallica]MCA8019143.1 iron-containing redox enzyme family protein [Burkholderia metallica]
MWRETYRLATDPEAFLDDRRIRARLAGTTAVVPGRRAQALSAQVDEIVAWRDSRRDGWQQLVNDAHRTGGGAAFASAILVQSAPLASVLGAWLQGMSAPGVFEDDAHLRIMALHAGEVGVGRPEASRYDRFKALLREAALADVALEPFELSTVASIDDEAFHLPALLLAMSRRADAFGPELAAVDLAFRSIGLMPCWAALGTVPAHAFDVRALDLRTHVGRVEGLDASAQSRWVVEQYAAHDTAARERIEHTLAWTFDALRAWDAFVEAAAARMASPRLAMARLMQQRAREAMVYHHEYKLGGRVLSEWFKDALRDPEPLVDMLAKSRLVVPGHAERSPLVTTLIGPGGRMFRVFSDDDLAIIRRWIDALADAPAAIAAAPRTAAAEPRPVPKTAPETEPALSLAVDDTTLGSAPSSLRELYFVLQGRALAPRTRQLAERYVRDWLARAARSLHRANRGLPATWHAGALRAWLLDQHDRHGREFEQSDPASLPSREEVIDSTLQLAPLTLIDGSWLQGFSDWRLAASQVGFALFQTYWDELGNGLYALNHPKIYRDGLREMGIELPPTGSRAFAHDPRFRDESFRLPVYWLCLGKLPRTFMPEILGMNLAMELSGVGGSYRSARRFLRHYGFGTAFVDLHNTIDNVSTGHSAWAVDAIDAYMRQAAAQGAGADVTAASWERVRIGYESLAPLPDRRERWFGKLGVRRWTRVAPAAGGASSVSSASDLFHHAPVARPA